MFLDEDEQHPDCKCLPALPSNSHAGAMYSYRVVTQTKNIRYKLKGKKKGKNPDSKLATKL
jgi:hypothetical protein